MNTVWKWGSKPAYPSASPQNVCIPYLTHSRDNSAARRRRRHRHDLAAPAAMAIRNQPPSSSCETSPRTLLLPHHQRPLQQHKSANQLQQQSLTELLLHHRLRRWGRYKEAKMQAGAAEDDQPYTLTSLQYAGPSATHRHHLTIYSSAATSATSANSSYSTAYNPAISRAAGDANFAAASGSGAIVLAGCIADRRPTLTIRRPVTWVANSTPVAQHLLFRSRPYSVSKVLQTQL